MPQTMEKENAYFMLVKYKLVSGVLCYRLASPFVSWSDVMISYKMQDSF